MNADIEKRLVLPENRGLRNVSITGTGSYLPVQVMTNAELEKLVDTTEEWIVSRTGMKERRIAAKDEAASDMASEAAKRALENGGVAAEDIGMITVATCTPDMIFPNTSCLTQKAIGATNAFCMDLSAACSGFLYGMEVSRQFVANGSVDVALVIGSEKMSCITDWGDRSTCVLFGDASGAALLQPDEKRNGILTSVLGSDGSLGDMLKVPAGGSRMPASETTVNDGSHYIKMEGKEVFKNAVTYMSNAAAEALERCNLTIDDVTCVIPHQANIRILQSVSQRLGVPIDKFFLNVDKYGNTSAASVGVALDEASRSGRIERGDILLLVAFGAGFTWGATLLEW